MFEMDNYLCHHGILGQKWGKRNGPPYPLGSSRISAAERKAKIERGSSSKSDNRSRDSSHKRTSPEKFVRNHLSGNFKSLDPALVDAGAEMAGLFIAALVVSLGSYAITRKRTKKETQKNLSRNGKFKDIKQIQHEHSEDDDMKAVNPRFLWSEEYQSNCTMCSVAYELRRRGYDVEASTSKIGRNEKDVASWFNIDKKGMYTDARFSKCAEKLEKMPEGARGSFLTECGIFMSKHSIVWEKQGGKIRIRDCQDGKYYDSIDEALRQGLLNSRSQYNVIIRTDNATINEKTIMDAVRRKS